MPTPSSVLVNYRLNDRLSAYQKGFDDCRDYRTRNDNSFQLNILNHPYEIPGGCELAYWTGWNAAEEEFRRQLEKPVTAFSRQVQADV